jgi:uncharacterized protein YdeI (YjbR/CyaY-like superfamily)
MKHKDLHVHYFNNKTAFAAWLKSNWQQEQSIWLKLAKKDSGKQSPSYEEAREAAICYGWIDGLINKFDDNFYLLKFSKRRPRSQWSKINREIAEELIKCKKMRAPGKAEIERAKQDGRWAAAYDSPKNMKVPKWFLEQVKKDKRAYKNYLTLSKAELYSIGYNLQTAAKEVTRLRRAAKFIVKLKHGGKLN